MNQERKALNAATLPLPLGVGRGEGTLYTRALEQTIASNVAEILEA